MGIAAAAIADISGRFDDVTEAAQKATAATGAVTEANRKLGQGLPAVSAGLGSMADQFSEVEDALSNLRGVTTIALSGTKAISIAAGKAVTALQDSRKATEPIDTLRNALMRLEALGSDMGFGGIGNVREALESEIGRLSGVGERIADVRREIDLLNGTKTDIDFAVEDSLARGALPQQAAELRSLLETAKSIRDKKEQARGKKQELTGLQASANQIFEATRTPLEKFASEMACLQSLQSAGLISGDTFQRAQGQAQERLDTATGKKQEPPEPQLLQGSQRGTKEAFDKILKAGQGGDAKEKPAEETAKNTTKMAATAEKQLKTLAEIKRNTSGGGG